MKIIYPLYVLIAFFIFSCNSNHPKIEGLDYTVWKYDQGGCNGDREKMVSLVNENKEQFLYFNQNKIISMFGKPENQTLFTRSQTIYFYHVKNSSLCEETEDNADNSKTVMLQIRFDALYRSKELFVYNYNDLEI